MSSSYIDYPLKQRHGLGWQTNSPDYNHTRVQTAERSTVLPEVSQYPNVHKLFHNKVFITTTNNEEQVHEDNTGSRPKNHGHKNQTTPPVVRFADKVEVIEKVEVTDRDEKEDGYENGNSEVHEETTLEQEADQFLEKKHKGFITKWKSYKDYY